MTEPDKWTKLSAIKNFNTDYTIIDQPFEDNFVSKIREGILHDQMWRFKNPISKHLHNHQPKSEYINKFIKIIRGHVKLFIDKNLELTNYWAMAYPRNTDGNIHADLGKYTITYWITPGKYNKNPKTGGIILYDVKRPESMALDKYLSAGNESKQYVLQNTQGQKTIIPYKFNRMVIFKSNIFHKTDSPCFESTKLDNTRINLTMEFTTKEELNREIKKLNESRLSKI